MAGFWQWIRNQIVQEVPIEIALCEFDCDKQQCTEEEWRTCPRRLASVAAQLMPASGSKRLRAGDLLEGDSFRVKKVA